MNDCYRSRMQTLSLTSDQNAIVIYCDEGDDAELLEAQAKAENSGRLVLVVQYASWRYDLFSIILFNYAEISGS